VRPPDLHDVSPRPRLLADRVTQLRHRGDQAPLHIDRGGDMHGRREGVVRRLRHVDVVVGVNRRLASERRSGQLTAAVGDDFVDVHVELGAAARHPHMQRKHVSVLTREDLVASLDNQFVTLFSQPLAGMVCYGGSLLQSGVSRDHFAGNQVGADAEMLQRSLCLGAPQLVRRHLDHAEAVAFRSHVVHAGLSCG
jgi:hypothetical protein